MPLYLFSQIGIEITPRFPNATQITENRFCRVNFSKHEQDQKKQVPYGIKYESVVKGQLFYMKLALIYMRV